MARYSDRPELWAQANEISEEVWPEYNLHGAVLGRFWGRLREELRDFQFVLYVTTSATRCSPKGTPLRARGAGRPTGWAPGSMR